MRLQFLATGKPEPFKYRCYYLGVRWHAAAIVTGMLFAALSSKGQSTDDMIRAHSARARAAQERGDFEGAAAEWQAIIRIAPAMAEASSNLGMMWHFAHHYPNAIEAFRKAIKLNPNLIGPHLFLGIDYYLMSHPKEAIPELNRVVALEPHNALARKWLGMSHLQLGHYVDAVIELELATRTDARDSDLLFWLSRAYTKVVFQCYEKVRELAPDSTYLASLRAESATEKLNPKTLEENFVPLGDLVRKDPQNIEHWYQLGLCAKALALTSLDAFLTQSPEAYQVHQLQAEYFLALGNEERALAKYHDALVAKPDAIHIHQNIGDISMSHHEYADAIASYEAELRVDPYSLVSLERLGQAYAELNNPERANEYLTRAIAIDPSSYEARRALGKICFARGDYQAAVKHYLKALENKPERDSSVLFQLSNAYRQLGNKAEADRWLAQFKRERENELNRVRKEMSGRASSKGASSEPSKGPVLP